MSKGSKQTTSTVEESNNGDGGAGVFACIYMLGFMAQLLIAALIDSLLQAREMKALIG